ncbi:hypothetical protein MSAN_00280600 [Mycena sanguinolenta]|uniref:F-box domain-containing protein n=1 Tax=Mycena sanguinolenta TaxID=230812 RepID=A0A8H6ZAU8_9AGAR|nr:hypothetical protein MSAN_00280600 [Mycena sanguinolenta]
MTPRRFGDTGQPPGKQDHTCQPPSHSTMVLTRRATRELRSIIRRLPAEVLLAMCGCASDSTLASLCSTSRTMRALATPVLYRSVSLTGRTQAKRFIETVASRPGLAAHVRHLSLQARAELSGRTTRTLNRILPLMTRLEDLDLRCVGFWLEGGMGSACFGELRSFRGLAISPACASLRAFLDRHGTITTLDVVSFQENENRLPAVHLPRLAEYAGSASFLSYLDDATVKGIRSLDLRALDANFGAVLSRLAPCADLRRVAGTLVNVEAAEVIDTVGEHASQIEHMVFRARIPTDLPLADVAERLGALPRLLRLSFWRYTYPSEAAGAADTWGCSMRDPRTGGARRGGLEARRRSVDTGRDSGR